MSLLHERAEDLPPACRAPRLDRVLAVVSGAIAAACTWLVAAMLTIMLVCVLLQVLSRYWLHFLGGGPEEIARLCMVGAVFLALPALAQYSENIRLDVAQELLSSAAAREWLTRLALAAEVVFLTVLSVLAIDFVQTLSLSSQRSPSLELRLYWSRMPVPVGAGLGALVSACVLVRRFLVRGLLPASAPAPASTDRSTLA
ncbi:TRAP transporter small permease [Aeromicrobium sp. 50.2.37]|uniref:TRAP transporter small permease n=1 Tax=Aeromicrobium sp. 50.2.37 TaxID=2969305 RepID=UPI0021505B5A|nr:TRAP transporter small permease subunit [Aeromicrobium sp. 50.2.37]MCR4514123.1 TRAP transporter small permease subunit [Aeromicrobium sp. 50.2.37]